MYETEDSQKAKPRKTDTTVLDSPQAAFKILRLLELLEAGTHMARSADRADRLRICFFALKDQAMAVLHRLLRDTGAVSYHLAPYVKRCVTCKKRADVLHTADPSRSWEYHLNLLPTCPRDEEILDRSTVSMTVRWQNRKFNLHAPRKEALKWNLAVDDLDRKVWVPDRDFDAAETRSSTSLQTVVDELGPILEELQDASASEGSRICTVFVSAASTDYALAVRVLDFLTTNNRDTFLAPVSLATRGDADFRRAIEDAIDSADHMVVVVSEAENAGSQWVQYECGLFLNEKLAGRKAGNLLTVATESCRHEGLPIALRTREIVPLTEDGLHRLLGYLK